MFDFTGVDKFFDACILLYIPSIFTLKFFIDRLNVKTKTYLCDLLELPWANWCFLLSGFSFLGMCYTGYYLFNDIGSKGVFDTSTGFWYHAFIISKLPELLDTIFIVARSKPLVAIQWFHHWATMLICYAAYNYLCDEFTPFFFMNYFVHFFMYAYFGLYCFFGKSLRLYGTFVNIIQTLQMLLAIIMSFYIYISKMPLHCVNLIKEEEKKNLIYWGTLMYIVYLFLFISLFLERNERLRKIKV